MPEKLKTGWTRVAFGDVVRLCRDRSSDPAADGYERYVGLEHIEPGDLKIRRWGNVADGTTFTSIFRAGQVLFGKRRAYQRKVAVPDFDGVCSGDIYVLEPKNEHLLPELLPFICQTDGFFEHAVSTSAGSLSPRTNWESLVGHEFALPPLEEQRRIAEVLEVSDAMLEDHKRTLSILASVVSSLAQNCFSRASIQETVNLSLLVVKLGSGKTPLGGETVYTTKGVLFLRSQNIYQDGLRLQDVAYIPHDIDDEMQGTRVLCGDVLLNITGASIGRCTIYTEQRPANVNQHVCIIRPTSGLLDPYYLTLFIQSVFGQRMIAAHMTNGNRQGLNFEQLGNIPIPLAEIGRQTRVGHLFRELLGAQALLRSKLESVTQTVRSIRDFVLDG